MRKGRKDICQTTGKGTTWVMIATNYCWRGRAASHRRARMNTKKRKILKNKNYSKLDQNYRKSNEIAYMPLPEKSVIL